MERPQEIQSPPNSAAPFRLDVQLHNLLRNPSSPNPPVQQKPSTQRSVLPEPVFPQRPELLGDPAEDHKPHVPPDKRHWTAAYVLRAMRGWLVPYVRSR